MVFIPTDGHGYRGSMISITGENMWNTVKTSLRHHPVTLLGLELWNANDKSSILKAAYSIIHALKSKKYQKRFACYFLTYIFC